MKRLLAIIMFAAASLAFSAGLASAASNSTGLTVQVTAVAACNMSTTSVNFGNYATGQSNSNLAIGGIYVNCPIGITYSLSMGTGNSWTGTNPQMKNITLSVLNYQLYSDMYNGTPMTNVQFATSVPGSGSSDNYVVYGVLQGNQNASTTYPGYSDSVTVTISY